MTETLERGKHPTMRRFVDRDGPDWYVTPNWVTHALCEVEAFEGPVWEPACGDGAMARVLEERGCRVQASDLFDRGYGETGVDFLASERRAANVVTNPPFKLAEEFVHHGLRQADRKLCLFVRQAFLEGARRQESLYRPYPPVRIWQFSERITLYPGGVQTGGSGTLSFIWVTWVPGYRGPTEFRWLPLGMKAKYSRLAGQEGERVAR